MKERDISTDLVISAALNPADVITNVWGFPGDSDAEASVFVLFPKVTLQWSRKLGRFSRFRSKFHSLVSEKADAASSQPHANVQYALVNEHTLFVPGIRLSSNSTRLRSAAKRFIDWAT